jgi:hypothetical protein
MYLALFRPQNEASGPDPRLEKLLFRLMMSDRTGIITGIGNEPVSPPQRSTGCRVENSNCGPITSLSQIGDVTLQCVFARLKR